MTDKDIPTNYVASACSGKVPHTNRAAALRHLKSIMRRHKRIKGWCRKMVLRPYQCKSCRFWHVGNERAG